MRLMSLCLATGLALGAAAGAAAGTLSVMPTRVDFAADRAVQSLLLTNMSGETVTVEAQVVVWPDDAAGQQANDVVVTPAVVTLPPNQRARVRIGLLRRSGSEVERAYRVYFTELPAPASGKNNGISVRLRIGIPIFIAPVEAQPAALAWSAREVDSGWQLEVSNRGNVHARLGEATLATGTYSEPLKLPAPYVLPGRKVAFPLMSRPGPGARVRWTEGGDAHESPVTLP